MRLRRRQAGFTMVEMLIVVAIVGLLASIAVPVFARSIKKAHRNAVGQSMLQVHDAMARYYADNGAFPVLDPETFEQLVSNGYLKDADTLLSKCKDGEVWLYFSFGEFGWWLVVYPKGDTESSIFTGHISLPAADPMAPGINLDGVYWYNPTETPWGLSRLDGRPVWP